MDLFVFETPVTLAEGSDGLALFTVLHNSFVLTLLGKFLIGKSNKRLKLDRSNTRKLHEIMISKANSEQNADLQRIARKFRQRFASRHQPSTETTNPDPEEYGQPQDLDENEHENNTVFHRMKRMLTVCHKE